MERRKKKIKLRPLSVNRMKVNKKERYTTKDNNNKEAEKYAKKY